MTVDSRRLAALFVWSVVMLCSDTALAQTSAALTAARYEIEDRGQRRTFTVATDEIYRGIPNRTGGRVERIPNAGALPETVRSEAARRETQTGEFAELVLYPDGEPRTQFNRRILTRQILARVKDGTDAATLATANGVRFRGNAGFGTQLLVFEANVAGGALEAAASLRRLPAVLSAEPQLARQQQKRAIPNDTLFPQQWHLKNTGQGSGLVGADVNVTPVWDNYRGTGMRIGIVDDGIQLTHPDLLPNVDTVNDHDWNDSTPDDPSPDLAYDFHGTSCAGVAAGRGSNGLGISGAAPEATLVGLRLIAAPTIDSEEAEAMSWLDDVIQLKSNSWGPSDDARTLEGPGPLTIAALEQATKTGRNGRGTIFVWAGGNGGDVGDNSNYDGYANSIYTIAIGAIGNDGKRAYYSEPGANLIASAPSSGATLGIVTTDLIGNYGYNVTGVSGELTDRDYTNDFGGTSSAAPLAAGCIALLLEANPLLGWRDVQEILIRSAKKVDPTNTDWITNSAGFHFNHDFGAGLLDTNAAVDLAKTWSNLPAQTSVSAAQTGLSVSIPDNNSTGITRTFDLSATNLRAEKVTVTVNIQHTSRGQLAVTLTSPSGTQSRLAEKHSDTGDNYTAWTFSTVRNWGEDSQGVWTLKISDLASATTGKLTDATLVVYGTPAAPVNQPPRITSAAVNHGPKAFDDETLAVGTISASDADGDVIAFAYQWEQSVDNVTFARIPAATTTSLAVSGQSGRIVRCQITPIAAGKSGAPFATAAISVDHRPPSFARHGIPFSYDSDLFLASQAGSFSRPAILNEFSQGASGSKEWIELLILKTADLRGYTLGDRGGTYVTFSQSPTWSAVAPGTLVVIYNANDRDTSLPIDDPDPAGGSMIISHKNTTFFAGTSAWGGLSNSAQESIILRNPDGQIVDALSLNNENVYDPKLGTVGAQKAAFYTGNTDVGADSIAEWTIATITNATPASGNGSTNAQFVADLRSGALNAAPKFRFGAANEAVPGLFLDPDTGVISGTPIVPAGGLFSVVVERFTNSEVVTQAFMLLIAAGDGSATVPAGKVWTLTGNASIPGPLSIGGTLDTAGHQLVVGGLLSVASAGTVTNASGTIAYQNLVGPETLPGTSLLSPDPLNDLADPDGDGLSNLTEFAMGTPSRRSTAPDLLQPTSVGGTPGYTYRFPKGAIGVTRTVQVSNDMITWKSGAGVTEIVSESDSDIGFHTITVRDLTLGPFHFARLKISR